MAAVELGGILGDLCGVRTAQAKNADTGEVHVEKGIDPFGLAGFIPAIGDDEQDAAARHVGKGASNSDHGVPEAQAIRAAGVVGAVEVWGGKCVVDAGTKKRCAGWKVVGGADQGAVQSVEGNVVLRVEKTGRETGESDREVPHDGVMAVAGVDQDGEADRIIAFEAHLSGVEWRASVKTDVELCEGYGWERLMSLTEDERGDLDEVGVDVQRVGSGVLRGDRRCAGREEQSGEDREYET